MTVEAKSSPPIAHRYFPLMAGLARVPRWLAAASGWMGGDEGGGLGEVGLTGRPPEAAGGQGSTGRTQTERVEARAAREPDVEEARVERIAGAGGVQGLDRVGRRAQEGSPLEGRGPLPAELCHHPRAAVLQLAE